MCSSEKNNHSEDCFSWERTTKQIPKLTTKLLQVMRLWKLYRSSFVVAVNQLRCIRTTLLRKCLILYWTQTHKQTNTKPLILYQYYPRKFCRWLVVLLHVWVRVEMYRFLRILNYFFFTIYFTPYSNGSLRWNTLIWKKNLKK